MLKELNDYDWEQVFKYAAPTICEAKHKHNRPSSTITSNVSTNPFTRDDVQTIIGISDGENDGQSWIGLFQLKDGRFAYIEASCDYTGWG